MMRKLIVSFLGMMLCTLNALAQAQADPNANTSSGPSAWVYVSNLIGSTGTAEVHAYTAGPGGKLTPISGSPFSDDIHYLAVNGKYLFGSPQSGTMIEASLIQSNGAITYSASTDSNTPSGCGSTPANVFLDHSGSSLYDLDFWSDAGNCGNTTYQAWSIVKSSGKLTFLNAAGGNEELEGPLTFIGNNVFAYTADCYHSGPQISAFKRSTNGSLSQLSLAQVWPKPPGGDGYCPYLAAADPSNHLAIPVQPYSGYGNPAGPFQLATYTVNTSTGAISTSSTYDNMPKVSVGNIMAIKMSPSGKLLAVAGTAGLQVFHFNGANPITHYTGLISTTQIDDIRWDNNNHLYAISQKANRLTVFTLTPVSWSRVATYSINKPMGIAVQPLPLPWQ